LSRLHIFVRLREYNLEMGLYGLHLEEET
jgi:hypothetical protein